MTADTHAILQDCTLFFISDKDNYPEVQNSLLLLKALPFIRRIAREMPEVDKAKQSVLVEFCNYLQALLDEFAEKPWTSLEEKS